MTANNYVTQLSHMNILLNEKLLKVIL